MARILGAIGVLGTLTVVGAGGGSATATTAAKPGVTKVKMEFNRADKELFFDAPATVAAGDELQIKNNTNPRAVGPHTFSLVREQDLPQTRDEQKACSRKFEGICGAIAIKWHEVDLQTGQIGENPVEVGKQGWDRKGSLKRKGDSIVIERKGEKFQREVTAEPGKELYFICAVHAEMQGQIDVVEGS
jgi:hypothetical protein